MQQNGSWERIRTYFPVRVVMVWVMVFIAIVVYAMAWFTIGSVAMTFINACLNSFDFGSPWTAVVELIKNIILWHPIISLFGWILWGFLNSMRRDVRTWEVG